jgi:hypothetical protein
VAGKGQPRPAGTQALRGSLSAYCFFLRSHGCGYDCSEILRCSVSRDPVVDDEPVAGFTLIQLGRYLSRKYDHESGVKHPLIIIPHPWLSLRQTFVILQESP